MALKKRNLQKRHSETKRFFCFWLFFKRYLLGKGGEIHPPPTRLPPLFGKQKNRWDFDIHTYYVISITNILILTS